MPSIAYAVPVAAVVSLVYTATRFEIPEVILRHAAIMFGKAAVGLAALYWLLVYLSS